jgi:formylglycine-generating enzyme required for sulfatase activity
MPLAPGQVLNNRYRIVRLLGQGGFGAVYRAWDTSLSAPCALKENLETSLEATRQFAREASLLANLRHPNLPKVTDHFTIPGQGQYLAMEYIEGEDLVEKMAQAGGCLPEATVLPWIIQACDALTYLHSRPSPVIHRDIKPANLRITPEGTAMLVDFGVAKLYDPARRTTLGARAVTPGYAPFEQYGQRPTDARTDVYALGATLYHALTGQTPPESIDRVAGVALIQPCQLQSAISPQTEAALLRALEIMPEKRFQSAAEFKGALLASPFSGAAAGSPLQRASAYQPGASAPGGAQPGVSMPDGAQLVGSLGGGRGPLPGAVTPPVTPTYLAAQPPASPPARGVRAALPWGWLAAGALALIVLVLSGVLLNDGGGAGLTPEPTLPAAAVMPTTVAPTPPAPTDTAAPGGLPLRITDNKGVEMALVPAGEFLMGSSDSDSQAYEEEKPQHKVYLDNYYIDLNEVTNAMFARFVDETGYQTEAEKQGNGYVFNTSSNSWEEMKGVDWRHPRGPSSNLDGLDEHPVVLVSWDDAVAYCQWRGARLPIEAEWEKAARGTDGRIYPWGNGSVAGDLLNFADRNLDVDWADKTVDDGYQFTAPVGSYPSGASPYGLLDMAGNVWEWVKDWYLDTFYKDSPFENPPGPSSGSSRVVRGGSWGSESRVVRVANRYWSSPSYRGGAIGLRCARSP